MTRRALIASALAVSMILAAAQAVPAAGVYTYHDDTMRTGAVTDETGLSPSNVSTRTFGKLFSDAVDGYAYAQPLYVAGVSIPGSGTHNVVYVATEHDSVYAFDADTGAALWQKSLLPPGASTVSAADVQCVNLTPEIGITGTPVIDPSTGTMYVVAKTKESGSYFHRLHALDIATGAEKFGGPVTITASVPGNGPGSVNGIFTMSPLRALQRSALLLKDGVVYVAFASNCDLSPYDGWVLGYDVSDLSQDYAFNAAPDGSEAGIWMAGSGPAALPDTSADHDIYVSTGNGTFDAATGGPDYGDSVVRLSPGAALEPADYFTPSNQQILQAQDLDLGSAGVVLLPDQSSGPPHLLVTSSKQGTIYLIDRDAMSGYNPSGDLIVQEFTGAVLSMFSTPSFWNGTMYTAGVNDTLKAFALSGGQFNEVPVSQSSVQFPYPGATTSVSSNGSSGGIVWAIHGGASTTDAILYAFDASDLSSELYDANQNPARDLGSGKFVKFAVPTVAAGKVYVGTTTELNAYGLIDASPGGTVSVTSPGVANLKRHRWVSGGIFTVTNTGNATEPISSVTIELSNAGLFSRAKLVAKAGKVHRRAKTRALQHITTLILNRPLMLPAGQTATFKLRLKGAGGASASEQEVSQVSADIYWFTGLPASLGSIAPMAARSAVSESR